MTMTGEPTPPAMSDGEDQGNHGNGEEGKRVDAGSPPPPERTPAEGTHPNQAVGRPVDIVTSIIDFALGVVDGSVATELVIDLLALAGAPDDSIVAAVLTEGLHALDQSHACRGRQGDQCLATCELLASDCQLCAGDASCLDAMKRTCGKDSARACK
jgi:hypothetical protein